MPKFRVLTTPAFEKDARKLTRRHSQIAPTLERLIKMLEQDPYNHTGRYSIKKLGGLKPGQGQWRIRSGDYRLRYDIFGQELVLHSFRHRKEAYERS